MVRHLPVVYGVGGGAASTFDLRRMGQPIPVIYGLGYTQYSIYLLYRGVGRQLPKTCEGLDVIYLQSTESGTAFTYILRRVGWHLPVIYGELDGIYL